MAGLLGGLFKRRRTPPPTVETDEIVPVHIFDDLPGYRKTLLMWTFQFNDVLDVDKLRGALFQLIEQGEHWSKLGGRLRLNKAGKLEVHIPRPFTAERPPVRFSHNKETVAIGEHPLASKLPKPDADGKPSTYPGPLAYSELGVPSGAPRDIEDYLYSDEPQLALHVVSFTDATFVSLLFLHTVADEMGLATLIQTWQEVLAGSHDIPPLMGFREDPMAAFYDAKPVESHVLADQQLRGRRLAAWVLRFAWEIWRRPAKLESRTICIPPATMTAMRRAATSHLSAVGNAGEDPPFISDGDILAAWVCQMSVQSEPQNTTRSATVRIPIDARGRIADVFPEGCACVGNAILLAYLLIPVLRLLHAPLGETALEVRKCISEQGTRTQFDALARLAVESLTETNSIPIMGDTSTFLLSVSNWGKSKFFDRVDFSPAVVKPGTSPGSRPGHVVYYHAKPVQDTFFASPLFTIAGKDVDGNYWLNGDLPPPSWAIVDKSLATFAEMK